MRADTPKKEKPTEGSNPPAGHADAAIVTDTVPKGKSLRLSPRESRVLSALHAALGTSCQWISREQVDRTAHCSNGPDVILRLREKLGHDAIDMQRVETTDCDGRPSNPGRYRLTGIGLSRLAQANWRAA